LKPKQSKGQKIRALNAEPVCAKKIEFVHDSVEMHHSFKKDHLDKGSWIADSEDAFGDGEVQSDGRVRSYIYFSREGDVQAFGKMLFTMAKDIEDNAS
jgi:hypothetical protein